MLSQHTSGRQSLPGERDRWQGIMMTLKLVSNIQAAAFGSFSPGVAYEDTSLVVNTIFILANVVPGHIKGCLSMMSGMRMPMTGWLHARSCPASSIQA